MSTLTYPYYREILAEQSAMWSDQYALTMAQALFSLGMHELPVTFEAFVRKTPNDSYLMTAGQNIIAEWYEKFWKFDEVDLQNLRRKTVINPENGERVRLYTDEFIDFLAQAKTQLTIDAMPEGEIAFPNEAIYRVFGAVWQGLMVEAAILNTLNSQSPRATLASNLAFIAGGSPVVEFMPDPVLEGGLRRAPDVWGIASTRAAYIGGVTATSNNLAEKYYDIPVAGTMAHAFVMLHESELEAFMNYAKVMPYNGVYLVDTYNTPEGIRNAARACKAMGVKLKGVRLDSGDLAYLSKVGRKILDEEGFPETVITNKDGIVVGMTGIVSASNDLNAEIMNQIKNIEHGNIRSWLVGTNLVSPPPSGAVYKLKDVARNGLTQDMIDALREKAINGTLVASDPDFVRDVIKLSEDNIKCSIPGATDTIRSLDSNGHFAGDTIVPHLHRRLVSRTGKLTEDIISVRMDDDTQQKTFAAGTSAYYLTQPMYKNGKRVSQFETVHDAKKRAAAKVACLDDDYRRLINPRRYRNGLEQSLFEKRKRMIQELRAA